MLKLLRLISAKCRVEFFYLLNVARLKSLGRSTSMVGPYRIDGGASIEIGAQTIIQARSWLYSVGIEGLPSSLKIGKGCALGYGNHITAVRDVMIGDHVLTANNVYISDNVHAFEDIHTPILKQPVKFKNPVRIGDGSWIGENVCIIGASIGKNCVIGANAVVTSDIPDYSVAVGIPARVVKRYDPESKSWLAVSRSSSSSEPAL